MTGAEPHPASNRSGGTPCTRETITWSTKPNDTGSSLQPRPRPGIAPGHAEGEQTTLLRAPAIPLSGGLARAAGRGNPVAAGDGPARRAADRFRGRGKSLCGKASQALRSSWERRRSGARR
ncbi:hypothetical protein GCM10010428_64120 [Actinosynnema pretiosum subsp. pretiosum]